MLGGVGGGIAGALLYYLVRAMTSYEIGIIAIAVWGPLTATLQPVGPAVVSGWRMPSSRDGTNVVVGNGGATRRSRR